MRHEDRVPLFLALAGIIVVAIGVFLPMWDAGSVSAFSGIKGNSLLQSGSGWITLGAVAWSAFSIARAFQGNHELSGWGMVISGVVILGFVVYTATSDDQMTLCSLDATSLDDPSCERASPGLGIYATGLGGALLVAAGLLLPGGPKKVLSAPTQVVDPAALDSRAAMDVRRDCPHCGSAIRPEASMCPSCSRDVRPWRAENGTWWDCDSTGQWARLDASSMTWIADDWV